MILNKDFKYSFPYGEWAEPQIEVIAGKYKGLVFDVMSSAVVKVSDEDSYTLNYDFKILKVWESITEQQFQQNTITLYEEDSKYIGELIYSLIKHLNKK